MSLSEVRYGANGSSARYLSRAFHSDPPEARMMPGIYRKVTDTERMRGQIDCDEVYPGIIIGTGHTVKNVKYLNKLGVTHVLNMAEGDVNLNPATYAAQGICYKGFRVKDLPGERIACTFDEAVAFIDRAQSFSIGLVFVNCLLGQSRAATAVAAYLMTKRNMSATDAITLMRKSRDVRPNMGFLHQLGQLDDQLRSQRYRR